MLKTSYFKIQLESKLLQSRIPDSMAANKNKTPTNARRGSIYNKTGTKLSSASGSPFGVISCLHYSDGQVYITDEIQHCVHVYDVVGKLIKKVGTKGSNDSQFLLPMCIALSTNSQLAAVADSNNHRIRLLSPDLERSEGKFSAHAHEIKKGKQPGEFLNPQGCIFTSTPTGRGDTKTVCSDFGELSEITTTQLPLLIVADTGNDRIQVLSLDKTDKIPPLVFGTSGTKAGSFKEPSSVAYHDGWTDRDKKYSKRCQKMRSDGVNAPFYFIGDEISRAECFEQLQKETRPGGEQRASLEEDTSDESREIATYKLFMATFTSELTYSTNFARCKRDFGEKLRLSSLGAAFLVRRGTVPDTFRLLQVTTQSFRQGTIVEKAIQIRGIQFFCPDDKRDDGMPILYDSLQALIEDGEYIEVRCKRESRKFGKIAVVDTGNDRIQILGFLPPSFHTHSETGKNVILFPALFSPLQLIGSGSKGAKQNCHLTAPRCCAYNKSGDLIVCDSGHWRVCM